MKLVMVAIPTARFTVTPLIVAKSSEGFTRFDDGMNAEFESLAEKRKAYSRAKRLTGLINLFDDVQMEEKGQ